MHTCTCHILLCVVAGPSDVRSHTEVGLVRPPGVAGLQVGVVYRWTHQGEGGTRPRLEVGYCQEEFHPGNLPGNLLDRRRWTLRVLLGLRDPWEGREGSHPEGWGVDGSEDGKWDLLDHRPHQVRGLEVHHLRDRERVSEELGIRALLGGILIFKSHIM